VVNEVRLREIEIGRESLGLFGFNLTRLWNVSYLSTICIIDKSCSPDKALLKFIYLYIYLFYLWRQRGLGVLHRREFCSAHLSYFNACPLMLFNRIIEEILFTNNI
jgi:hypothetical protein